MAAETQAMKLLRDAIRGSEEIIQLHRRTVDDCRARIAEVQRALAEEEASKASFESALRRLEESAAPAVS